MSDHNNNILTEADYAQCLKRNTPGHLRDAERSHAALLARVRELEAGLRHYEDKAQMEGGRTRLKYELAVKVGAFNPAPKENQQ
jgi:hypothetical protein